MVLVIGVIVRPGAGAAIGIIAEGVDMETFIPIRVVAGDFVADCRRSILRLLREMHNARDGFVSSEHGDWIH